MVDKLLLNNGYSTKVIHQIKSNKEKKDRRRIRRNSKVYESVTTLKVPFLSNKCTAQIKRA